MIEQAITTCINCGETTTWVFVRDEDYKYLCMACYKLVERIFNKIGIDHYHYQMK